MCLLKRDKAEEEIYNIICPLLIKKMQLRLYNHLPCEEKDVNNPSKFKKQLNSIHEYFSQVFVYLNSMLLCTYMLNFLICIVLYHFLKIPLRVNTSK